MNANRTHANRPTAYTLADRNRAAILARRSRKGFTVADLLRLVGVSL